MRSRNLRDVSGLPLRNVANANSITWLSESGEHLESPTAPSAASAFTFTKLLRKLSMLSSISPKSSQEPRSGKTSGKNSFSLMSRKARSPSDGLPGFKSHFLNSSNKRSMERSSSESVWQSSIVSGASLSAKRLANCTPRKMRSESSTKAGPTWRNKPFFKSSMPPYGSHSVSSGSSMPIALMVKSRRSAASLNESFSSVCTTKPRWP